MKQTGVELLSEEASCSRNDTGSVGAVSIHSFAKTLQPVEQDETEVTFIPETTRTGSQDSKQPAAGAAHQGSEHDSHLAREIGHGKEHEPQSNFESELEIRESVCKVRKLLNRRMRVMVTDGRIFEGTLSCLDKQGNLLLNNATEFSRRELQVSKTSLTPLADSKPRFDQRSLGLILIPKHARTSCQFQHFMEERLADLSLV